jgi:glycosyltransferase involved in cell wall biosynthesis
MLTGESPPDQGGVGDYAARLSEALATLGVPVGVLTRRRPGLPVHRSYRSGDAGIAVPVHARVETWDARAWRQVCRALARLGPRPLLHIQFQAGAYDLGGSVHLLPGIVRSALPRARVVTTFHDFLPPYLFPKAGALRVAANRLLARTSHAAIFTDLADLEQSGVGVRGHVVPIGSNLDPDPSTALPHADVHRLLGADDGTFLVGYFGFLNASKGVPTLLEAIGRLAATRPVKLALIGGETGASDPTDLEQARAIDEAIERQGLKDMVIKTGFLPPRDLSATLLACDALALPFRDGAAARRGTLMAALAHGLPTVSTIPERHHLPSSPPAFWLGVGPRGVPVRDGEAILLIPPDDPATLADALARLADDEELRSRLAAGARVAAARIAWPTLAAETAAIYAQTFEPPGGEGAT